MSPTQNIDLNPIGVVLSADGEVFLQSDSGARQVESGAPVYAGDKLITGSGSAAEIRFADDTLLSQGADSSISLDDYVYDNTDDSASELLFKMSQGTFRMVTGKIAEQNPERFKVGSPLATIGIRGTITVHEIGLDGEKHGVEEIHSGKALLIQSIDGQMRQISSPRALVDIASSGLMSTVRVMTVQEFEHFQSIAPSAIQAEQEIQDQRDQEQQDLQNEQNNDAPQNDGESGQGAEGGEAGGPVVTGEGVFGTGAEGLMSGMFAGEEGFGQLVDGFMLGVAQEALDALSQGDLAAAQELLDKLENIPDDPDILELLENAKNTDISEGTEGTEGQSHTSSDGITWILGTSGDDNLHGTPNTDYINGLAGNDAIAGEGGKDYILGGAGNDSIDGGAGDDTIDGGEGNDTIAGGEGDDFIKGGVGNDIIHGDDISVQTYGNEIHHQMYGNDTIDGGEGSNIMHGGDGTDFVSFASSTHPVTACLVEGTAKHGDDIDHFYDFEGIIGSDYDDSLYGNDQDNTFIGGLGNDIIDGGVDSNNTVSYISAKSGVVVSLVSEATNSGGAGNDTLTNIQNLIGSDHGDFLTGNDFSNILTGGVGADTMSGGLGNDTFHYSSTGQGGDTITDFTSGDVFKFEIAGGFSSDAQYESVDSYDGTAGGSSGAHFIFAEDTGKLWYDADGSGTAENGEMIADIGTDVNLNGIGTDLLLV